MLIFLACLGALLYLFAAYAAARQLPRALVLAVPAAALLTHGWVLAAQTLAGAGLSIGVWEAVSLLSWQAALLLWLVCLRQPLQLLGVALYPLAAAVLVLTTLLGGVSPEPVPGDWRLQLHVTLSVLSAGLLTLAALQAFALALQDRLLHRHHSSPWMSALPPLQTMERLLFGSVTLGFALLTLSLLTGLLFVSDLFAQHLAHKTFLSICAWLIFGILLWGRRRFGWRGRTAMRWLLSGYATLVLAYFGSKIVLEVILGRSWG